MRRRLELVVLLALANAAAYLRAPETAPDPAAGLRARRAAAQSAALAAGRRDYTFETSWSPPLGSGP